MATKALRFTQLDAWKLAPQATLGVYRMARGLPPDEWFILGTQMRRAAISVPANLAEGYARRRPRDKAHFYTMARSSAEELRYYFILARDLGYITPAVADTAEAEMDRVCGLLYGMIESMEVRMSRE